LVFGGPESFLVDFEEIVYEISVQAMMLESVERKLTISIDNMVDLEDELNKAKT
jgi:hypothetical protein